jgi:protein-S-isoprenylcysteine O-methyltransferase Ste14
VTEGRPPDGTAAGPGARSRLRAAAGWRDLLLGRVVPASLFGIALMVQANRVRGAWASVRGWNAGPGVLAAVDALMVFLYYGLLVALYVARLPPRDRDRRPPIALAAFGGSFLSMCIPFLPAAPRRDWLLLPADLVSLAGIVWTIWSLLWLGRSFAILPQARRLVTGGPYSLSRNPLYLGEIVGGWSVFLPTLSWPGALVLAANLGLQLVRVRAEERVLARSFGEDYAEYRRRVPRFVPLPRPRGRRARELT